MTPPTPDDPRRDLAVALGPGDRVGVTGASGFIGSAVVRALVARDASVVALVEPGADGSNLEGIDVERIEVDVRDREGVGRAVRGCRALFHVAALYRFWARDPRQFYDVNVGGTLNVIDAARAGGVERMVYTSTVGTLGLDAAHEGSAADERNYPDVSHLFGSYKRSKYVAEHEVLRAAAQGLPVTIVMPTFPLGPRDRVPTPTGRLVLDYLNGRVPGYVDTTLNVVHVDDVAAGHVLALERGDIGRSYILGGENYSLHHLLDVLAACTGLPRRRCGSRGCFLSRWLTCRSSSKVACCAATRRFPSRRPGCRRPGWRSTTPGPARSSGTHPGPRPRPCWTRPGGSSTTGT